MDNNSPDLLAIHEDDVWNPTIFSDEEEGLLFSGDEKEDLSFSEDEDEGLLFSEEEGEDPLNIEDSDGDLLDFMEEFDALDAHIPSDDPMSRSSTPLELDFDEDDPGDTEPE